MKIREPNYQMLFDSAVIAKQVAYQEYKAMIIVWIQATWIGSNGEFATIKGNYAERLKEAYNKFVDASIEVEHYRKLCADMRGDEDEREQVGVDMGLRQRHLRGRL